MTHTDQQTYLPRKPQNRIGRGMWTTAYKVSESEVEIETSDWSKECMNHFCQGNPYIPTMEYLETLPNDKQVFRMPYYHKLRAKHEKAWADYKGLKAITDKLYGVTDPNRWIDAIEASTLDSQLKEAVLDLVGNFMNYTDQIFLEVTPRNLAVDENGHLILLDILVDADLCKKAWEERGARRTRY